MVQRVTFYSFELKLDLNLSNLREYYFQAVSNSSWANQGYLVYKKKDSNFEVDVEFKKEIFRMHNMFGIGIIALDINNLADSEIIVPAKSKEEIDWLTVDKLTSANSDFAEFLELVKDCLKIDKSNQKGWDETDLE